MCAKSRLTLISVILIFVFLSIPFSEAAAQTFSLWADEERTINCVEGELFNQYDVYVFLDPGPEGAMAAEYLLNPPLCDDLLVNFTLNDFIALHLGDPLGGSGISLAFKYCQRDPVWLQKLTFYRVCMDPGYFSLYPHSDTEMIAIATCEEVYPKKTEAYPTNVLQVNWCPNPPRIAAIETLSPISIRVDFSQGFNTFGSDATYYSHFTMYDISEPSDTVQFIAAYKENEGSIDIYLVTDSPMVQGTTYYLEAEHVCDYILCGDSGMEFTYEGGFEDLPDLDIIVFSAPDVQPDSCAALPIEFSVINYGNAVADSFDILIECRKYQEEYVTLYHETFYDLYPESSAHGTIYVEMPPATFIWPEIPLAIEADAGNFVDEWVEFNNSYSPHYLRNYNPSIIAIDDYPDDFGGKVIVGFNASYYDYYSSYGPRVDYEIYRRSLDGSAWTCIATVPGTDEQSYQVTVPTEADSSYVNGLFWSVFSVNAVIDYGWESYMSCPDSGYSVDNSGPIATELVSSSIDLEGSAVRLSWVIYRAEGSGDPAFKIQRSENEGYYQSIPDPDILSDRGSFRFDDFFVQPGRAYSYRIFSLNDEETWKLLFETDSVVIPPMPLSLQQNWPNPFNPDTEIRYFLPEDSFVNLTVYDITGRAIACLVSQTKEAGNHIVNWNGLDQNGNKAASGVYIYRIQAGKENVSRKMILLR